MAVALLRSFLRDPLGALEVPPLSDARGHGHGGRRAPSEWGDRSRVRAARATAREHADRGVLSLSDRLVAGITQRADCRAGAARREHALSRHDGLRAPGPCRATLRGAALLSGHEPGDRRL